MRMKSNGEVDVRELKGLAHDEEVHAVITLPLYL